MKQFDDIRADQSAEERFYNRSVKIRRWVLLFLDRNVGRGWPSLGDMADECGNSPNRSALPFSSQAAGRWIHQFTAPNFAFGITSAKFDEDGLYRIMRRRALTARDFRRWGINPPKRFKKRATTKGKKSHERI